MSKSSNYFADINGYSSRAKAAYNHAEYLKERKVLMQWWSDYLDELKISTFSL